MMDNIGLFIFLAIVVISVIYSINIYNNLVRIKHNVSQSWSNIDILLKQRHDELPKLVEVCKQYMDYEGSALEKIISARSGVSNARQSGDMGALGMAEGQLRLGLGSLFAVSEAYPELKANENFQHLQNRITGLEDAISDRREYYNDSVNINNIRIEQFPDVIIARFFNFTKKQLLEFDAEEKKDVDIKSLFN